MKRRTFITLAGGAAAWAVAARAQQTAVPVVGFFNAGSPATSSHRDAAFRQGLREIGFMEGKNLTTEYRWAEDQYDRLPALAADLVQRRVAVIAASPRAVDAAKAATTSIPIVFMSGADPVRSGLVASLNRPGGNLTGVTILASDLTAKRFEILHEVVPQASVIGVLRDGRGPAFADQEVEAAARQMGLSIRVMSANTENRIDAALSIFAREGAGALFVTSSFLFVSLRHRLAALAARNRIPAMYDLREFPDVGGLMSYGPSETDAYRQVGRYTGRILKGDKPTDLPVMLPTKFELVINAKTAKTLGLEVPPTLLARADEVIE
jgi:ABC-type uncharacterized transport system substrate-binding protein